MTWGSSPVMAENRPWQREEQEERAVEILAWCPSQKVTVWNFSVECTHSLTVVKRIRAVAISGQLQSGSFL